MARARKRHIQQPLPFRIWGGKRKGAGRPKKSFRASEKHKKRPPLHARFPVLVTCRIDKAVGSLRRGKAYHAFRKALASALRRADFRVVHVSLQRDHAHLVVEATDERALARGMQGLQIAAAHRLNAVVSAERRRRRTGRVFSDRYHARILRTPSEVRRAINYVLNNWRHHKEDRDIESMFWEVDYFSSGPTFRDWKERPPELPTTYLPLATSDPSTWLLCVGWTRAGGGSRRARSRAPIATDRGVELRRSTR